MLRVAQVVADTEAEGPGRRYALWLQGCDLACPGCCNPEMFDFAGGAARPVAELADEIRRTPGIEGLSVLGGEPFAQAAPLARLLQAVQGAGLGVMVYTGYTLDELRLRAAATDPAVAAALAACDLLVDGRYRRELPEARRRWVGSTNQVVHFLTSRYRPDDPRFLAGNTVEIRLAGGALSVNGWPAAARGLVAGRWRRARPPGPAGPPGEDTGS